VVKPGSRLSALSDPDHIARGGNSHGYTVPLVTAMPSITKEIPVRKRTLIMVSFLAAVVAAVAAAANATTQKHSFATARQPVQLEVLAPRAGDVAGKQSKGFVVDLALRYPSLAASGADFQLTGPAAHQNQAPFPGTFAPGVDEKVPGLIVLLSTTTIGAHNAQNLANLFNLTGFTNQTSNEIWDTWIAGVPSFGKNVGSVLRVAVAADKNKDGIYNDAPAVIPDSNHDGRINNVDLKAYGVASNIAVVPFQIHD
jgi:hypothetical protein